MTSQGQRFRRRSLRRGYKVEEVDSFLDRVEATLNGERVDSPVRATEVREVVFRVKFGGYDEWQVDLHLDRVERQLAEQEPDQAHAGQPADRMGAERVPDRPPAGMMTPRDDRPGFDRPGFDRPGFDRPGYDQRGYDQPGFDRPAMPGGLPARGQMPGGHVPGGQAPAPGMPVAGMQPLPTRPTQGPNSPTTSFPRYDDTGDRAEPEPPFGAPPGSYPPPGYRQNTGHPPAAPTTYGSRTTYENPAGAPTTHGGAPDPSRPGPGGAYGPNERGVHADRTAEMRVQSQPTPGGPGGGPRDSRPREAGTFGGPARPGAPGTFGNPVSPSSPAGPGAPGPGGGPGMAPAAPAGPPLSTEIQHIVELRRGFQPRRFGSGYDPVAVENLFDGVLATLSGRAARPVGEADLDPRTFNLVPGGYYEDEVDNALREARDMLRRR